MQVARRLRALIEDLLATVPEPRKATVRQELGLLARSVERSFPDAEDRGRARVADRQGLGSSGATDSLAVEGGEERATSSQPRVWAAAPL